MPKGLFTQSAVVLQRNGIDVHSLTERLREFEIIRTIEGSGDTWMGAPRLTLSLGFSG